MTTLESTVAAATAVIPIKVQTLTISPTSTEGIHNFLCPNCNHNLSLPSMFRGEMICSRCKVIINIRHHV